jgi:hypothetical protein
VFVTPLPPRSETGILAFCGIQWRAYPVLCITNLEEVDLLARHGSGELCEASSIGP